MKEILSKPFFQKFINPVFRGFIKQVPIVGTPIVELATNLTTDKVDGKKKHSYVSITIQFVIAILTIYDFVQNDGANVVELLNILKQIIK